MKMAVIFVVIVLIAFLAIFMITRQIPPAAENTGNFLTPTPDAGINLPGLQQQQGQAGGQAQQNANSSQIQPVSGTKAVIKTEKGDISIDLYPEDAPKTVTNFATLSKNKYYDNLTFHRVEPGFVIQGGDPNGNGTGGTSIYGAKFEDELDPNTPSYKEGYKQGVVAMANSGPDTNGSQFFIMLEDNPLPNNYTIFGKVTAGMNVVQDIEVGDTIQTIEIQ